MSFGSFFHQTFSRPERRNLTPYQRAELALALESIIAVKAKENLRTHTEQGYVNSRKAVHTDVELAKTAGVGEQIIHRARVISERADDSTKAKLRAGEVSNRHILDLWLSCHTQTDY